ncbi:MAG: patatin-like phospholipase family protein [Terriglobales bacterium]
MTTNTIAPSRPRCLLSIDGGGLCGLIPAQALILIEQQLDQLTGDPQPLSNRFDLIGGTSTGAILAAGLALGMKAADLSDFYLQFGPDIFKKVFLPEQFWHKYPSGPIEQHLKDKFGEATVLGDPRLRAMVLLVTKNATLGNDWFFTNNPKSKFFANNAKIPLWHIVRASSAAPTYFPPHAFDIPDDAGKPQTYEFIDGGVSSYNNPSLQVFLEATIPEYGIGWPMGVDNLLLISLGTGFAPVTIEPGKAADYNLLDWAQYVLKELMNEANLQQNVLMHLLGERPTQGASGIAEAIVSGASAAGTPSADALTRMSAGLGNNKLVTYQRITVELSRERLDQLNLPDVDPVKVREMDAVDQIPNMQRVGEAVANEQVHMERLLKFFKS